MKVYVVVCERLDVCYVVGVYKDKERAYAVAASDVEYFIDESVVE